MQKFSHLFLHWLIALSWTLALIVLSPAPVTMADDSADATPAEKLVAADRVLVIAHRGDSLVAPENTLPAFESAVGAGSDLVELDYVHSADGVPVVIHDYTLDRTTDAEQVFGGEKIPVASKSMSELLKLDAGSWFDPKFAGTRLPSLEQALDTIQTGSMTLIERKAGDAKTCVELLKRRNLLHDVVVQAFDWEFLADCHALEPDLVLGALGAGVLNDKSLTELRETGAKVVGWQDNYLNREQIGKLHDAGYRVWAWTVDNSARASALIDAGIDGVITNAPAKVNAQLPVAK